MSSFVSAAVDVALDRTIAPGFSRIGFQVRRRAWHDGLPGRMDGTTIAVTGATSGIGEAAATAFAARGARVLLLARSLDRAEAARGRIAQTTGSDALEVLLCDLGDLASVRHCAKAILETHPKLGVLVNNAGVLPASRQLSADGIELTFATNVIGPFLLTNLLVPALAAGAPSRVINVSSGGMYGRRLKIDDLQMERGEFDGVVAYARSKRAEVILTELWAERLRPLGIFVHAMHPGWVDTPGVRESLPRFYRVTKPLLRSPEQGADTIVWLASDQLPGIVTGGFWHDRRRRPTHVLRNTRETDVERALLWKRCVELSGYDPSFGDSQVDPAGAATQVDPAGAATQVDPAGAATQERG